MDAALRLVAGLPPETLFGLLFGLPPLPAFWAMLRYH
jgi:hypothetical protein